MKKKLKPKTRTIIKVGKTGKGTSRYVNKATFISMPEPPNLFAEKEAKRKEIKIEAIKFLAQSMQNHLDKMVEGIDKMKISAKRKKEMKAIFPNMAIAVICSFAFFKFSKEERKILLKEIFKPNGKG